MSFEEKIVFYNGKQILVQFSDEMIIVKTDVQEHPYPAQKISKIIQKVLISNKKEEEKEKILYALRECANSQKKKKKKYFLF